MAGHGTIRIPPWLVGALVGLGWLASAATATAAARVEVVLSADRPVYHEVAEGLRERLSGLVGERVRLEVHSVDDYPGWGGGEGVVVGVGSRAAERLADAPVPSLAVLIPRRRYLALNGVGERAGRRSALYLDQPVERRFRLIRAALPERRRVAVLLGPDSAEYGEELVLQANRFGFSLAVDRLAEGDNPVARSGELLHAGDVLLALADPAVYNGRTLRGLLLTSYRLRVPLIGLSEGYVKAGAFAGLYSTPGQLGREAAEMVAEAAAGGFRRLPAPRHPRDFSVSVNERVAHSLGLSPPSAEALRRRLAEEEREP